MKKEKVLNDFLEEEQNQEVNNKQTKKRHNKVQIIDKKLVTEDGRQLLREHY
ncbi:MAG: hypothetical protein ACOC2U_05290 [bacterium]